MPEAVRRQNNKRPMKYIFTLLLSAICTLNSFADDHSAKRAPITPPDGVHAGHEYVDLGLPSGTLWATCNLGVEDGMSLRTLVRTFAERSMTWPPRPGVMAGACRMRRSAMNCGCFAGTSGWRKMVWRESALSAPTSIVFS